MSPLPWAWIGFGSLILGGLFSALFYSLRDLSRSRLEELAERRGGDAGKARVAGILENLESHAIAVAFPRVTLNLVVGLSAVLWVAGLSTEATPSAVSIAVGVAVASLLVWIFGLAIPNSVARHAGAAAVYTWAPVIRVTYILTAPLTVFVKFIDEVIRRLSGANGDPGEERQAELLSVVEDARHEGQFDQEERDMIEAVLHFKEKTVQQIMTPRTEMEAMRLTDNLGEISAAIRRGMHSRIPVYEGTIDHIIGVFYVKDLMRWLAGEKGGTGRTFELRAILRPALFVPETKTIRELLTEMLEKKVHLVMVADEYGGTAGLVTIEDIVEEIVGDIQDEYEHTEDQLPDTEIDEDGRAAAIDARVYIHDANEELAAIGIELPESEDYETVGGYVSVNLGRIPAAGERATIGAYVITVLSAEPTRVERVRIEHAATESKDAKERDAEPAPSAPAPEEPRQELPARASAANRLA